MSNKKTNLREKILDTAQILFNSEGVEYIGIRELAKFMGIKAGNITYYFATKDDLVAEIGMRLQELNNQTIRIPEKASVKMFMVMVKKIFENHYQFRGLFLSMPNLIRNNKVFYENYVVSGIEKKRRETGIVFFKSLIANKQFRTMSEQELNELASFFALTSRGWIAQALVSFPDKDSDWQMKHFLHVFAHYLENYCTASGKKELSEFLKENEYS
jgi:AcrR family transcriptional regulator